MYIWKFLFKLFKHRQWLILKWYTFLPSFSFITTYFLFGDVNFLSITRPLVFSVSLGIGCGVLIFGYGQLACWVTAAERQTHRIRLAFFRNAMRQEIGWFDTHDAGELNTRLTGWVVILSIEKKNFGIYIILYIAD